MPVVSLKIPLQLTAEEEKILDSQSKILNWLYNNLLSTAKELREEYRKTQDERVGKLLYTKRGLRNTIPQLKEKHPFLKTVYSSPVKNAALRLSSAIQEYQKRKKDKSKKQVNWPKFRSWKKKWFSLLYDEPYKGYSFVDSKIKLSLGKDDNNKQIRVELNLNEKLPSWFDKSNVKQLRITKQGKQFFAIFSAERSVKKAQPIHCTSKIIAIDPNHKNLGVGVDNTEIATEIKNPYFLKTLDKRIDLIKSKRDRCKRKSTQITREDGSCFWKPSRRWLLFNDKLQELYRIRREQIKVFLYSLANRLFREYDVVSVGDYTPNGGGLTTKMRRAMNNQSLIGQFKLILNWVANRSGRVFVEWPEKTSTRTCHDCDYVVKNGISPEFRCWTCPECDSFHFRDENAARNGLNRTLQKLQMPCSGRRNISKRRAWRFSGLGVCELPGITDEQVNSYAVSCQEIKLKGDTLKSKDG